MPGRSQDGEPLPSVGVDDALGSMTPGRSKLLAFDSARLGQLLLIGASLAAALAMAFSPLQTADQTDWYNPWMAQILARGWRAISGEFSNYTPPYIYLLTLASPVAPFVGVKPTFALINLVFVAISALQVRAIVSRLTGSASRADWAGAAFFALPTVLVNSFLWGQCDIVYTCALLVFLRMSLSGCPWFAALAFGVAVSFKLQAVFLAPFVMALFFMGRMRVQQIMLIPVVYAAMMVPSWIAGRPPLDTFLVYAHQADTYHLLSSGAPNIWILLQHRVISYELGTKVGLALAAVCALALATWATTRKSEPMALLLVAALSAVLTPYVLPMMHDRYFFPADVLLFVLAFALPRLWPAAALAQFASLAAYSEFLGLRGVVHISKPMPMFGAPAYTLVLLWLAFEVWRLPAEPEARPPLGWMGADLRKLVTVFAR